MVTETQQERVFLREMTCIGHRTKKSNIDVVMTHEPLFSGRSRILKRGVLVGKTLFTGPKGGLLRILEQ
jgi:hypothetical protein